MRESVSRGRYAQAIEGKEMNGWAKPTTATLLHDPYQVVVTSQILEKAANRDRQYTLKPKLDWA